MKDSGVTLNETGENAFFDRETRSESRRKFHFSCENYFFCFDRGVNIRLTLLTNIVIIPSEAVDGFFDEGFRGFSDSVNSTYDTNVFDVNRRLSYDINRRLSYFLQVL